MWAALWQSQWSLTFEVRKRGGRGPRDLISVWSQWSLTFEVRKSWTTSTSAAVVRKSQWSLTFEVRKSGDQGAGDDDGQVVAMEPDL